MTTKVERCAIYIRVSTTEQMMHGKSLEAQKEYLTNYAREHNMAVVGIYADEGKTARKELKKRKAIHSLLQDVEAGKIDVIIFWRIDRWFRNLSDFYKVQDILDSHNVRWISTSEPGINMETRDGRLQLNVVLSIGQNEVDTTFLPFGSGWFFPSFMKFLHRHKELQRKRSRTHPFFLNGSPRLLDNA